MILYRPVGLQELELIYDSGMKTFPARLPQQPIFYPVLQLEYARQIASDWNAKSGQSAGYVTEFKVEEDYIGQFEKHTVGSSHHQEFWIPAEELEEFNRNITGHIKVLEAYFGDAFQGFVPEQFGLGGKNTVEQFTELANSYIYKRVDFYLEIKRNHKAIFLNYPFWLKHDFKNPGLKEKILKAIKEAWFTSFPKIPLPNPVSEDVTPVKQTDSRTAVNPILEDATPVKETNSPPLIKPVYEEPVKQINLHPIVDPVPEEKKRVDQTDSQPFVNPIRQETTSVGQTVSHFSQGLEFGLNGKYQEAIDELSKSVEEDPEDVIAHTSLGVAFHQMGDDDRAIASYESALKLDPKYAEAHYFRANILYMHGDVREAITGYTIAMGLKPELIEAHQKPNPQDRLTDYTNFPSEMVWIAKPAYRILDLNKTLESNPSQANLFKERAAQYSRLWNYEQAIADYSSLLKIYPEDAGALHLRGLAYEQLGQLERALEDYQQAIAINPQLSDIYINRGITFGKMGNFRQSIASLTEAIRLAPKHPDGYFNRGMTYFQFGDFESAVADFSTVIQLSSNDEDAYYWRGISNEEIGRQEDAIADYKRFLEISQNPRARVEIEQRLNQWNEGRQAGANSRRVVSDDNQKADRDPDIYDLIVALGERALQSTWLVSGVKCYGEKAEELYAYMEHNRPIQGRDFLEITSGIHQTIEGDFTAYDPNANSHWLLIRAWEGSGFYVEINDPKREELLKTQFPSVEEVEGADPPYQGLFIHV